VPDLPLCLGVLRGWAPLKKNEKKLARSFNFTFRHIDDIISLNDSNVGDFVDRFYPTELQIKDTKDTAKSASFIALHLEIDSEVDEKRRTICTHQT
jgi:hypothetical protein